MIKLSSRRNTITLQAKEKVFISNINGIHSAMLTSFEAVSVWNTEVMHSNVRANPLMIKRSYLKVASAI